MIQHKNLFTETFFKKNKYFKSQIDISSEKLNDIKKSIQNWINYLEGFQKGIDGESTDEKDFERVVLYEILGYHGKAIDAKNYTIGGKFKILGAGVGGGTGQADSSLGYFYKTGKTIKGEPQILIEYKDPSSPDLDKASARKDKLSPTNQCWNYLNFYTKAKWGIVSNFNEIRLYNKNEGRSKVQLFYFIVPKELKETKKSLLDDNELFKFMTLLKQDHLLSKDGSPSKTETILSEQGVEEEKVEKEFYKRYSELRKSLINELVKDYKGKELLIIELVQKFLDRIIFIWFCEDSSEELLKRNILQNELKGFLQNSATRKNVIWESVKGLFNDIDKGNKKLDIPEYNGELFKEDKRLNNLKIPNIFFKEIHAISEKYDFGHEDELNVNILGHIFEQSVSELEEIKAQYREEEYDSDKGKQKRDGIVYTPDFITRYIVENTVGTWLKDRLSEVEIKHSKSTNGKKKILVSYLKSHLSKIKIIDPACGSGAFLVGVFDYLRDEYHRVFKELDDLSEIDSSNDLWNDDEIIRSILQDNIYGVDLNFESVEITKLSLYLKTARKDKKLTALKNNIKCGNSLIDSDNFSWEKGFKKIMDDGGFDVVLGNPPYVRQELIKSNEKEFLSNHYETGSGTADLYVYFYEKGYHLLKENGYFGMITSNTFMRTSYGRKLRLFLSEKTNLINIFNFGDNQFFEGVATRPVITVFNKKIDKKINALYFELTGKQLIDTSQFESVIQSEAFEINSSQISESVWSFHKDKEGEALKEKLKQTGIPLSEYTKCEVYYGIKAGFDKAFVINKETKDRLIKEDAKSSEIIKPWIIGRDIHRWYYDFEEFYFIYVPWKIEIDEYKAILKHLEHFKKDLECRPEVKDGRYNWYALSRYASDYVESFEKPKIVYAMITSKPSFIMDYSNSYTNTACSIIPLEDYYLLSILNSKLICFYIKQNFVQLLGKTVQLKYKDKMENLPIAKNQGDGKLETLGKHQTNLHSELKDDLTYLVSISQEKQNKSPVFTQISDDFNHKEPLEIAFDRNYLQIKQKDILLKAITTLNDVQKTYHISYYHYILNQKSKFTTKSSLLNAVKKAKVPVLIDTEAVEFSETYKKICDTQKVILKTDQQIDTMVFNLYGLTDEEIKIIRES